MRKTLLIYLILILPVFVLMGCDEEDVDTEKPVIEVVEPLDHAEFHPGEEMLVELELSDNVGLKEFKIEIHYGGDHTHKALAEGEEEWSFIHIESIEGRNMHMHMDIDIPQDAKHGLYHFLVYCTDEAGNEAWIGLEMDVEDAH